MARAVIIAAPSSASGKTTVTLSLLAALARTGLKVASAKIGPDYIDPRYHALASGRACYNLDEWAMRPQTISTLLADLAKDSVLVVIEGVMGLFDGPEAGKGSTADLAQSLNLPVILVVNCSHQAQSVAALVHGFATFRKGVDIAGIILNQVSSPRHARLLTDAAEKSGIKVVGVMARSTGLQLPSRHLGLVQASEHPQIAAFIDEAGRNAADTCDLDAITALARPLDPGPDRTTGLSPLGQHTAIASDEAFGFVYPHLLNSWRRAGATLSFFSPLAGEIPAPEADAIFLPGGYPELHAGKIAASTGLFKALQNTSALIYGECGGYMVLGEALTDKNGAVHKMAGLLPVTTSFARRKLTLGYRTLSHNSPLPWPERLKGHEFHFSTITNSKARPLFEATDTTGAPLAPLGLQSGNVMGSWAHVIDEAAP